MILVDRDEHAIQNQLLLDLGRLPEIGLILRLNSGKVEAKRGGWLQLCPEGTSDLFGAMKLHGGTVPLAIEVKKPGEKPSASQLRFLRHIVSIGGLAYWTTSSLDLLGQFDKTVPKGWDGMRERHHQTNDVMLDLLNR